VPVAFDAVAFDQHDVALLGFAEMEVRSVAPPSQSAPLIEGGPIGQPPVNDDAIKQGPIELVGRTEPNTVGSAQTQGASLEK
jgi:hypothetical protein